MNAQEVPESSVVCSSLHLGKMPLREIPIAVDYSETHAVVHDSTIDDQQAIDTLPDPVPCPYAMPRKPEIGIFVNAERMPYLKSCKGASYSDSKKCSDEKLLSFLYGNLEYPEEMKSYEGKGLVVVQFMIEEDGNISDEVRVVRDPAPAFSEEALRVVELMKCARGMEWMPGTQFGKAVPVQYNLPIKFKPGGGNPYQ